MRALAPARICLVALLMTSVLPLNANAADAASVSQRKMAVGLAVAHVRAEFRKFPQAALPGIDLNHPAVDARRAASGRRLIFVSFDSELAQWGEYVTFEVCAHSSRIVRVDSGRVSDIGLYRRMVATIDVTTSNKLPSGCESAHS